MRLKPWHTVVVPHRDIREKHFDESVFAADLSDVVAQRGPLEYRDALTFFRKTYPTQGLKNLLTAVLARLSGQGQGEAVIQIQTPFGGGKTHSLIALYHLFGLVKEGNTTRPPEVIAQWLKSMPIKEVPPVSVVTFVGTAHDVLHGKTPWGELAEQLGRYTLLQEHDLKRRAPGKDLLHRLIAEKPTLILMDEIAEYVVKARDFSDQVMAFFQELTETVKVLPQCALVVTLPSSAPYGEEGERALHQLQSLFGRVEAIYTPVEGEEIYEVIRRRLFEEPPDPSEARRVAESYMEVYQRLGDDAPREVRERAYHEKLRKAYPFHPELIDLLFERWSTFPTFQRTRGVLRFLAEVVGDLYRHKHPAPLIQPAHLNLTATPIRRELLKHIGNEYDGVIAADIADGNAKAQKIDREMGSEYARFGIACGLATAIFFGSFSGSEKKGVTLQRLRLATLYEGIPPALIGDALHRLEDELWYLHVAGGLYAFSSQPNLNRILVEREEAVREEDVHATIRANLEKLAGNELRVTLWPKTSQDVPDTKELKLVVLSSQYTQQNSLTLDFIKELFTRCGTPFRTYLNTLLVLSPDAEEWSSLRQQVKRYLALRSISEDKMLVQSLSAENKKTLESKLKDAESGIPFRLYASYRHLARMGDEDVEWHDLGLPTVGERISFAKRVRDFLRNEDLLLERISPSRLLQKTLREDEGEKTLLEVTEAFLKYPQLPMLTSSRVAKDAIAQGVREGAFGVKIGAQIYYKVDIPTEQLEEEAVLIRHPEVAVPPEGVPPHGGEVPSPEAGEVSTGGDVIERQKPPVATGLRAYKVRVKLPLSKFADFYRGVLLPLQKEAEVQVEVSLEAYSESGIKPATLDQTVKETLRQIGAEILDETRD